MHEDFIMPSRGVEISHSTHSSPSFSSKLKTRLLKIAFPPKALSHRMVMPPLLGWNHGCAVKRQ